MKTALYIILVIAGLIAGIWFDNHLPGLDPTQTRQHP
jgi:hypothetical protein